MSKLLTALPNLQGSLARALTECDRIEMTLGLTLNVTKEAAFLTDGRCCVLLERGAKVRKRAELLDSIEAAGWLRLVGFEGHPCLRITQPFQALLPLDLFVEHLLSRSLNIERHIKHITEQESESEWQAHIHEFVLAIDDAVRDGHIAHSDFNAIVEGMSEETRAVQRFYFYYVNFQRLVEHLRSVLLRVSARYASFHAFINRLISTEVPSLELQPSTEIMYGSELTSQAHNEFTDVVLAVCSVLDIIYRLFVFATREPFGDPALPKWLHFPFPQKGKPFLPFKSGGRADGNDLGSDVLPYALPNLTQSSFRGLRKIRNDLSHNLASGYLQSPLWIGCGTVQVRSYPLRYVFLPAPDLGSDNQLLQHAWMERFFSQHLDAQLLLREWIDECCLVVDHTFLWIEDRLRRESKARS